MEGANPSPIPVPVFIWAKYVHAKVNSLPATHELRMTCLAGLPYMESAVFQSSLPFAKFTGRKTPCMRGLLFFLSSFPPWFCSASLKNCRKSKYRGSLGGAAFGCLNGFQERLKRMKSSSYLASGF